jgi:polyhydroxybutyrate depolymerase
MSTCRSRTVTHNRRRAALTLALAVAVCAGVVQSAAAATHTAGSTVVPSTSYTGQQNVLSATQVRTGSVARTLISISVFVRGVHAAPLNHMQVAVYADGGAGAPGSRIAQSTTNTLQANGWNVFAMPTAGVAANTNYWLAFNVDGGATQVPIGAVSGGRAAWRYPVSFGTWPTSYGIPSRPIEAKQYSISMTYSDTDVAPTPAPPPPAPPPPPPPVEGASGCGLPVTPGTTSQTLTVNGVARTYLMVTPSSLNATTPAPVILGLHGGNDTAERANATMGLTNGDAVLYVYPQAGPFSDAWAGWNVDPAGADFVFIDALLAELKAQHCIDAGRIFAAGGSNGAFFANSLLCNRPKSFKAAASVAGGGPQNNCSEPRAFMGVHGTADSPVPITTGRQSRDYWLAANQRTGAAPVPIAPAPCVSYPTRLNPVVWCEHTGGHIWPTWAGAAIRSFFLGLQ